MERGHTACSHASKTIHSTTTDKLGILNYRHVGDSNSEVACREPKVGILGQLLGNRRPTLLASVPVSGVTLLSNST